MERLRALALKLLARLTADRGPGKKPLWVLLSIGVASVALVSVVALWILIATLSKGLPSIDWARRYRPPIVTEVWSGDEQLIGEYFDERRKVVPYDRIPKKLVQAFIASEDAGFFDHGGVSYTGLLRGFFRTYLKRDRTVGGSTISQQTAKAILVSTEGLKAASVRKGWAGVRRKIREFVLTRRLEANFNKEQILNLYLNEVYLGHHSYGVQAAAENYFRKNVWELSLPEMALIAGLPQAPTKFSPFSAPERARNRRAYVLGRMLDEGMITKAEHDAARDAPITAYAIPDLARETAPYVSEHIRRDLVARYGNDRLLKEGLKVYTTVDLEREIDATAATLKGVLDVDKRQGFRGALTHLEQKDWEDFVSKETAFLKKDGANDDVVAGLITGIDKEGQYADVTVGPAKGRIPLPLANWARKPNPELSSEHAKIVTLKGVLTPGDVVLVREVQVTGYLTPEGKPTPRPKDRVFALEQEPKLQGALISFDPQSGYVEAMIGGYDFNKSEFNRAFQACRQPGSSFKPIIYSAAIEQRNFTASTLLLDAPLVTDDEGTGKRWKPKNFEETFEGEVPVRKALTFSMNTPAIRTLQAVGVRAASAWAKKLGITTPINEDLSMALGSSCVNLWDITNVYALFNKMGKRPRPIFLRRVLDRDGRVLEDHSSYFDPWTTLSDRIAAGYAKLFNPDEQVIKPETAFLITQLMTEVVRFGTGTRALALGKPTAGKTGTTNDLFDAWFIGYTKDLVTGSWIGYDDYAVPMDAYETGGHAALPIWVDFMSRALKGVPQGPFEPPNDNIVWIDIDPETGKRATASTRNALKEAYLTGSEPPDESTPNAQTTSTASQEAVTKGGL
ncbi:MAG: PBP1A family penicillin-binding protein [Deltaproteobacteria bacterium]|nr:PBP1A family penicillin-binding protein [Deltaproteobacteria bacterium]